MNISRYLLIVVFVCSTSLFAQTKEAPSIISKAPFSIGESVTLFSESLQENRTLNIYLPHGYAESKDKKYPVIYLLDGSTDEDFIHIAGLVQFASFPWIKTIPESIIVGIANVDRKRDFTYPTNNAKDKADFPTTGHSETFIHFLEKEVQPFVTSQYRVSEDKTLIGQSLGGLLATEILFEKPHLFNNFIIVSPSLWWDDESLLEKEPKDFSSERKIYIAVGKEGPIMERVAHELYNKLSQINLEHKAIHFKYLEAQDHGDALHLAVYNAFETLFQKEKEE